MSNRKITLPASAGYCAWDSDECWVMIAVDTEDEMNVLIDQLKPRNRVRIVEDNTVALLARRP